MPMTQVPLNLVIKAIDAFSLSPQFSPSKCLSPVTPNARSLLGEEMLWVWIFLSQKLIKAITSLFSSYSLTYLRDYFLLCLLKLSFVCMLCDTSPRTTYYFLLYYKFTVCYLFVCNTNTITVFSDLNDIIKFLSLISEPIKQFMGTTHMRNYI